MNTESGITHVGSLTSTCCFGPQVGSPVPPITTVYLQTVLSLFPFYLYLLLLLLTLVYLMLWARPRYVYRRIY